MTASSKNKIITRKAEKSVQVRLSLLDQLFSLLEEIVINRARTEMLAQKLDDQYREEQSLDASTVELSKQIAMNANRLSNRLQQAIMEVRGVKFASVFNRFPRLVKNIAEKCGKKISFQMSGLEFSVDRAIADGLSDPLIHLLRNAADHGIEMPEERKQAGKEERGRILLSASFADQETIIRIEDDGHGLNLERIKAKAVEKGLLSKSQAEKIEEEEIRLLLFRPGFSTVEEITDLSGRGVGMDVVKSNIEAMGGELSIESELGKGTSVTLRLPIKTAVEIMDAMLVEADGIVYALEIKYVAETLKLPFSKIQSVSGRPVFRWRDEVLTIYDISLITGKARAGKKEDEKTVYLLIMQSPKGKIAFRVDGFLKPNRIVFSPLDSCFSRVVGVSGLAILNDEKIGLIFDPESIFDLTRRGRLEILREKMEIEAKEEEKKSQKLKKDRKVLTLNEDTQEIIDEYRRLLNDLQKNLNAFSDDPENSDVLHVLFRVVHSFKGSLGMDCLKDLRGLLHAMENLLTQLREGLIEPSAEMTDVFNCVEECLKSAFSDLEEGFEPAQGEEDELKEKIQTMLVETGPPPPAEMITETRELKFEFSAYEQMIVEKVKKKGLHLYDVFLLLQDDEMRMPFAQVFLVFRQLLEFSDIISSIPGLAALGDGNFKDNFRLCVASEMPLDVFQKKFHSDVSEFVELKEFQVREI